MAWLLTSSGIYPESGKHILLCISLKHTWNYFMHLISSLIQLQWSIWILLYLAQKKYSSDIKTNASNDSKPDCETKTETGKKNRPKKYSVKMRTLNWISLGVNVFFHFAHLLQTHVFYDALAPTVYEGASQGSVIFMLLFIMMMETERRGIFFGYGIATALDVSDIVKRYHGERVVHISVWKHVGLMHACSPCAKELTIF